jgi:hypothetical protein
MRRDPQNKKRMIFICEIFLTEATAHRTLRSRLPLHVVPAYSTQGSGAQDAMVVEVMGKVTS